MKKQLLLDFYSDTIGSILCLLVCWFAVTMLVTIFLSGSWFNVFTLTQPGAFCGMAVFYHLRGKFSGKWWWAQLILNYLLSGGSIGLIAFVFSELPLEEMQYAYLLIPVVIGGIIAFNKQLLDLLADRLNAPMRRKKPMRFH